MAIRLLALDSEEEEEKDVRDEERKEVREELPTELEALIAPREELAAALPLAADEPPPQLTNTQARHTLKNSCLNVIAYLAELTLIVVSTNEQLQ